MSILKTIFKFIGGLLIGIIAGLIIAAGIIAFFTDMTFAEFFTKLKSIELSEGFIAAGVGVLSFFFALLVLIPVHEAGHLVCGLLTGYKFVSFRIFNFTFIKKEDKVRVKKYSIAGTGGQCLLSPPDLPLSQIPTGLYNAGGVLANIVVLLLILPLLWVQMSPLLKEFIFIFLFTDIILILMNGIPLQLGGVGNDAYNMLLIRRSAESKRGMLVQLESNALIQDGVRPKDMPVDMFLFPESIDYRNALEVSVPLMAASRHIDEMDWEKGKSEMLALYEHRDKIMPLYVKEIGCELVFLLLVTGEKEQAMKILDKDLKKYIETYRKVMSSKERIMCAVALYIDNDRAKAIEIYNNLIKRKDDYLLQGEVKSDLALMEAMLGENR